MNKTTLTKTALAKALAISRQEVHRYAKQGMPIDSIDGARAWRSEHVQARVNPKASDEVTTPIEASADPGYLAARRRRETAEASLAEMREQTQRGELVNRAGAERAMETAFRFLRDRILAVPDRMAIPRELQVEIANALREALTDAAKTLPTLADTPSEARPLAQNFS